MRADKHAGKRRVKPLTVFAVIVCCLAAAACLCAGGVFLYVNAASKPVSPDDDSVFTVTIPEGLGTRGIARVLEENGLIGNVNVFLLKSRLRDLDTDYQAGAFEMSRSMSMDEIMDALVSSAYAVTKRFTVPEGYTLAQTAEAVEADGAADAAAFLAEARDGAFDYRFLDGIEAEDRLEGFLYPETYDVFADADAHAVIDRMLGQFEHLFTDAYYERAAELGLSIREVVTIASLVERETKVAEERARVSSVIHNRLAAGMQLQIDATVQYALGEQKERLLYADLEIDSPYNTYKIAGLPPGPICSSRIECVEAALYPEKTDYLYYVLKPELNGTHNFTRDYAEFLRFKDAYLQTR